MCVNKRRVDVTFSICYVLEVHFLSLCQTDLPKFSFQWLIFRFLRLFTSNFIHKNNEFQFKSKFKRQAHMAGTKTQVTGHRSLVTGHRSQVQVTGPGHRSQVQVTRPGPGHRSRSQVTGPGHRSQIQVQVTGLRSQVTDPGPGHRSQVQVTGHRSQVQVTENAIKKLDTLLGFSCLFICFIFSYITIRHMLHMFGINHASRCSKSKGTTKAVFTSTLVLGLPWQGGYPGTRTFLLIFNQRIYKTARPGYPGVRVALAVLSLLC